MKSRSLALLILVVMLSPVARSFPEMTRFGYNNCMACHLSPTGGGLLTPYGRRAANELINTWGTEQHTGVFWGAVDQEKIENWVWLGGDFRGLQLQTEDESVREAKFIKMQGEVSAALNFDWGSFFMGVGQQEGDIWRPISTNFWTMLKPHEQISIRAGRFVPAFGLHVSDHIAFIRSFLGFGLKSARDSVEAQWTSENWSASVTHAQQVKVADPERSNSVQVQGYFGDRFKLGADLWQGQSLSLKRQMLGFWGILGFTKKLFLISELDWQTQEVQSTTKSFVTYQKLGYTLFKGLDAVMIYEKLQADLDQASTVTERRGPGFQWTPVAHIELSGMYLKQRSAATSGEENEAWLVFHYYL